MDQRTFHPGGAALGRRRIRPGAAVMRATSPARSTNAAVRLTGSSMRVMEASLAVVAIATAILIGLGR
ncbi:MAG TPA: hypothetical protein VMQ65_07050 [Candidatus Limnocylindria bacterium]|nr:hypothetical protein [Candidatus Limnocylindria bacterium]